MAGVTLRKRFMLHTLALSKNSRRTFTLFGRVILAGDVALTTKPRESTGGIGSLILASEWSYFRLI